MTPSEDRLSTALLAWVSDEIQVEQRGERVACLTPLLYPDGGSVTVWVTERTSGDFEVTDYGEGMSTFAGRPPKEVGQIRQLGASVAATVAVEFMDGRMQKRSGAADVAEAVWTVATASARLAEASIFYRPRIRRRREFPEVVAQDLQQRDSSITRDARLAGASGHEHKATLYLPRSDTLIEPISPDDWGQASATFVKFSDIAQVNGHRLYAVLDDREQAPEDDVMNLLVQVRDAGVVRWSEREEWVESALA